MRGRPCIRGLRVTVGMIVGLLAAGYEEAEVLAAYPYLERRHPAGTRLRDVAHGGSG